MNGFAQELLEIAKSGALKLAGIGVAVPGAALKAAVKMPQAVGGVPAAVGRATKSTNMAAYGVKPEAPAAGGVMERLKGMFGG